MLMGTECRRPGDVGYQDETPVVARDDDCQSGTRALLLVTRGFHDCTVREIADARDGGERGDKKPRHALYEAETREPGLVRRRRGRQARCPALRPGRAARRNSWPTRWHGRNRDRS